MLSFKSRKESKITVIFFECSHYGHLRAGFQNGNILFCDLLRFDKLRDLREINHNMLRCLL